MGKISLALILIVGFATFYLTSLSYKQPSNSPQKQTFFDASDKLHVMGIVLDQSTLRDAELAFQSLADAAVFLYPKDTKEGQEAQYTGKLEAYFTAIADHSKVFVRLRVSPETLEKIRQNGTSPRIYPNGVLRINLGNDAVIAVKTMLVQELTFAPSVQLTDKDIFARFGEPEATHIINVHQTSYHFPKIGLTAVIDTEGKDTLTFSNHR